MRMLHFVYLHRIFSLFLVVGWVILFLGLTGIVPFGSTTIGFAVVGIATLFGFGIQVWFSFQGRDVNFPSSPEGFPSQPSNVWVNEGSPLDVGTRVLAYWQNQWWRAVVVGEESKDRVLVHYVGWNPIWNEVHKRTELQFDTTEWVHEWPEDAQPLHVSQDSRNRADEKIWRR